VSQGHWAVSVKREQFPLTMGGILLQDMERSDFKRGVAIKIIGLELNRGKRLERQAD